ncbi:MAG: serine hydrolase domain-containing protein [Planctomycetota bacterium]
MQASLGLRILLLLLPLATTTGGLETQESAPPAPPAPEPANERASRRLDKLLAGGPEPALSVAVAAGGRVVFARAVGLADVEAETPASTATRFRLGSTSKALTSVALGQLVDERRLDLDAPVSRYLPDFPTKAHPFTARQLASHQAGIRHYRGQAEYMNRTRYESVTDALALFRDDPLLFEPGTRYSYSTHGYTLLSAVLEAADGRDFPALMQRRVFTPLGMERTGPEWPERDVEGRATYYQPGFGDALFRVPAVDNSCKWAGGGFESTPSDLATFGAALLAGRLVKEDTRALLFTPNPLRDGSPNSEGYALGWRSGRTELPGHGREARIVHHGGTALGGRSFLALFPDDEVAVSLLANYHAPQSPFGEFAGYAVELAAMFVDRGESEGNH